MFRSALSLSGAFRLLGVSLIVGAGLLLLGGPTLGQPPAPNHCLLDVLTGNNGCNQNCDGTSSVPNCNKDCNAVPGSCTMCTCRVNPLMTTECRCLPPP